MVMVRLYQYSIFPMVVALPYWMDMFVLSPSVPSLLFAWIGTVDSCVCTLGHHVAYLPNVYWEGACLWVTVRSVRPHHGHVCRWWYVHHYHVLPNRELFCIYLYICLSVGLLWSCHGNGVSMRVLDKDANNVGISWTRSTCLFGIAVIAALLSVVMEHSRDIISATTFSNPGICSTVKLYCCISHFHLNTLVEASWFKNNRFRWSVRMVNGISLRRYWNFFNATTIA